MKNIFFTILTLISLNVNAQTAADQAAVGKMWDDVWKTYESGNDAQIWAFYAENATEIYPDGSMVSGVKAMKEGYEMFKSMLESKPTWTISKPEIRFITPDVALLTSNIVSDIKLKGGQQVGGKAAFAVIVHKVKGQWLIEFDSQTPVMQAPEQGK